MVSSNTIVTLDPTFLLSLFHIKKVPLDGIHAHNGIYNRKSSQNYLSKQRYWKITPDEIEKFVYDEGKLLNWEIKCTKEPEEEARFIGVFMYRNGTPYDYESIKGLTYYYNNIPRSELPTITKFLQDKFGGKEMEKGERIFLKDSKELYSGKDIAALAREIETKFNTKAIITLEFRDLTQEEMKEGGLPEAKLLPIPGK